jgi:SPP1 gp7 family putative phage head morphogenesis protein
LHRPFFFAAKEVVIDMDEYMRRRIMEKRLGRRFGSHEVLHSKYDPAIPQAAEREYVRLANDYMRLLKLELEAELPTIKKAYKRERDAEIKENRRNDGLTDIMLAISSVFTRIENNLTVKADGFGLRRRMENLANLTRKLTVKEWKKAIKATLGIDIREDYYLGDFYRDQLDLWVAANVDLIKTIPHDSLSKMRDIVYDGFVNGKTTTRMTKDIQQVYGVSKRRAEFIARDQVAKLNGQIQQAQQQDAGIEEYIWSTVGDERVRDSHRELNGKKFSWSSPPENSDGRACHPGEDFGCRCIGRPVFNRSTLNLPIDESTMTMEISIK